MVSYCVSVLDPAAKLFLKNSSILESKGKVPLSEDAQLQKLSGLARAHADLDWEMILQNHLTSKEEVSIAKIKFKYKEL